MVAAEGLDPTPRYEDSRLDVCVYELHVWLLAADRHTVIAQHHVAPRTSWRGASGRWVQVRSLPRPPLPRPHGGKREESKSHRSLIRTSF